MVLATMTVNQSNGEQSSLWHDSKKLRIPSSKLAAVPKTARADPQKFVKVHLYPRFKGTADKRHGTFSEPKVRKDFESECLGGRNVALAGTIVSRTEPYFSCSPDAWNNILSNQFGN